MDFLDFLKVLARQWYVVVAGILAMVAAAFAVIAWVPTQYQSSGQLLLLLPSTSSGQSTPTNPYLNLPAGLTTTASLVSGVVSGKETQRQVALKGFSDKYSVSVLPDAGPLIVVTANDTDPARALRTRDYVLTRIDEELLRMQLQVDVPKAQVIKSLPTNVDPQAEALPGSKIRALGASYSALLVLTLVTAFGLDRAGFRRGGRSKEQAHVRQLPGQPGSQPDLSPTDSDAARPRSHATGTSKAR